MNHFTVLFCMGTMQLLATEGLGAADTSPVGDTRLYGLGRNSQRGTAHGDHAGKHIDAATGASGVVGQDTTVD